MKYISISVCKKKYHVAQPDISRIHIQKEKKRPALPPYNEEPIKMFSPAETEVDDSMFSEDRK